MNGTAFHAGSMVVSWAALLVAVAVAQWLVLAIISMASRAKTPKSGMRAADRNLVIGSIVFALLWIAAFGSFTTRHRATAEASAVGKPQGSCTSINIGMRASDVQSRLGEPDERRNDEQTRGPSATMWIYRSSRCVVHVFDDKVEFID